MCIVARVSTPGKVRARQRSSRATDRRVAKSAAQVHRPREFLRPLGRTDAARRPAETGSNEIKVLAERL